MMPAGQIVLNWDAFGTLEIKTSVVLTGDNVKMLMTVLLDAAKAVNNTGTRLELPQGGSTRLLTG